MPLMVYLNLAKQTMCKKQKTITLLTERVENGIYIREHQTFTLKQYKKMLKQGQKGVKNVKRN